MDYQLVVDNDVFTLKFKQDQYYSSGIFPAVRFLKDSIGSTKVVRTYQLNHRIYTPRKVTWRLKYQLDRPYAGIVSFSGSNEYYFKTNQYIKTQLELGWIGPATGMDKTQITYHSWFGMPTPRGWNYQINNSPVVNLYGTYMRSIINIPNFEFNIETNVSLGTIYNNIRQELMIRIGDFLPLHKSALTGATIGNRRLNHSVKEITEFYMFYAPGVEYVLYNTTLEGNFIGKEAPFTVDVIRWIWQHRFGMMFSWPRFDLGFIAYWRRQENLSARNHNYVGIRLNQRF